MHTREVQINHKRPYTGGRDLSCEIRVCAIRDKRSLSAAAMVLVPNRPSGLRGRLPIITPTIC
jgi:hypothetical protein